MQTKITTAVLRQQKQFMYFNVIYRDCVMLSDLVESVTAHWISSSGWQNPKVAVSALSSGEPALDATAVHSSAGASDLDGVLLPSSLWESSPDPADELKLRDLLFFLLCFFLPFFFFLLFLECLCWCVSIRSEFSGLWLSFLWPLRFTDPFLDTWSGLFDFDLFLLESADEYSLCFNRSLLWDRLLLLLWDLLIIDCSGFLLSLLLLRLHLSLFRLCLSLLRLRLPL